MFGTAAYAQTSVPAAAGAGGIQDLLAGPLPMILMVVVLSSGVIGKVTKVEDAELGVEIATGMTVKVVRSMVSEVRARAEPANDAKPS